MKFTVIGIAMLGMLCGVGQVAAADGKAVYDKSCSACHNNMAPKLGDKAQWQPRVKDGVDALVAAVIKGKGTMPPKGGAASLSTEDIKAAVEYMMSRVGS